MELPIHPTRLAVIVALFAVLALSSLAILLSFWLRNRPSPLAGVTSSLLLFGGIALLVVTGFTLVYPHGHHNTAWLPGRYEWNYRLDALLGLFFWALGGLAYRRARIHFGGSRPVA